MVDRGDVRRRRRARRLQQILDEIDTPARTVALVAADDIGRAGRRAETAVHARSQYLFERPQMRIGELAFGEMGLHSRFKLQT